MQHSPKLSNHRGAGLMITVGIFFSILAIVGLGVDFANLYRAKLRLQRVVDATAINGAVFLGESGNTPSTVTTKAYKTAEDNLKRMGIFDANKPLESQVTVVVASDMQKVDVSGELDVPLLILGMVPFIGADNNVVAAAAVGRSNLVAISLVLDTTGSMNCPAEGTCPSVCKEIGKDSTGKCLPAPANCQPTSLTRLKESAIPFVEKLQDGLDFMALVTFSVDAKTEVAMAPVNTQEVIDKIDSLTACGGTNIEVGIKKGQSELNSPIIPGNARKELILFTDGAPSAGDCKPSDPPCSALGIISCGGSSSERSQKGRFVRTIRAADSVRADGIRLHTVALGPKDPVNTTAYQNATDIFTLKNHLLARVSNCDAAKEVQDNNIPDFDCVDSYQDYNEQPGSTPQGGCPSTNDPDKLQSLFEGLLHKIKPRLYDK